MTELVKMQMRLAVDDMLKLEAIAADRGCSVNDLVVLVMETELAKPLPDQAKPEGET